MSKNNTQLELPSLEEQMDRLDRTGEQTAFMGSPPEYKDVPLGLDDITGTAILVGALGLIAIAFGINNKKPKDQ